MDIKLYDYSDYKEYINDWIISLPKKGRGKYLELSKVLGVHTTLISQIFKGDRDLNHEMAFKLCGHLGLSQLETEYFLDLVSLSKAGTSELRSYYKSRIFANAKELEQMKNRLSVKEVLSEADKAVFYSAWHYSAIRLSSSLEEVETREDISKHLGLSLKVVNQAVEFLLSVSLLKELNGVLEMGPAATHLEASSPMIARHHGNWRQKAIEKHPELDFEEFSFSAPLTINSRDAEDVKEILKDSIEKISSIVKQSQKVDKLFCVNIDWFKPQN